MEEGDYGLEYLVVSVAMFLLGDYRSKMIGLYLVLSYYLADIVSDVISPYGVYEVVYTAYLIQPLVYILFFTVCYGYCTTRDQKLCVILCSLGYYSVGGLHIFYIPPYTEYAMFYSESLKLELIHNLCLTMVVSNRKKYYGDKSWVGIFKMFMFIYVWVLLKIWNWG